MLPLLTLSALRHPVGKQLFRSRNLVIARLDVVYAVGGVFFEP